MVFHSPFKQPFPGCQPVGDAAWAGTCGWTLKDSMPTETCSTCLLNSLGRAKLPTKHLPTEHLPTTCREQCCFLSTGPGISSYSSNPPAAGTSLVPCLNQALRDVPKEKHAGTPLYLGATAGMRLLK